jgi:hypothetical protein
MAQLEDDDVLKLPKNRVLAEIIIHMLILSALVLDWRDQRKSNRTQDKVR